MFGSLGRCSKLSEILRVENLNFIYGKGTPFEKKAVDDVSFSVNKGDFIGIIGHTGSGKSTLIQMLNGLITPTSGKVFVDNNDIYAEPKKLRDIRFRVGLVFQYPEYQLFEETVYKDIAFGPTNMKLTGEELDSRVRKAAKFVGLSDGLLQKSPFELSGGEKRRAAIAGVIAMNPEILILDEPNAGLDPIGKETLLNQIYKYHKESNNTVLLVSHSMEDIAKVTDKVIVMNKSKLAMYDNTKNIFSRPDELESMGLRVPQITKVMSTLRQRGYNLPDGILTVEQATYEIIKLIGERGN